MLVTSPLLSIRDNLI